MWGKPPQRDLALLHADGWAIAGPYGCFFAHDSPRPRAALARGTAPRLVLDAQVSHAVERAGVSGHVATGMVPGTYCTDDGAGLVFEGTHLAEMVTERDGAAGYLVHRGTDGSAIAERLGARRLP